MFVLTKKFRCKCKMDSKTEAANNKSKTDEISNISKGKNSFTVLDIFVIILSILSIVADLITDVIIVIDYFYHGYNFWALATFSLIVFPSIIVQMFSMRWHIIDKSLDSYHWISHICLFGIIHRYFKVLQVGLEARRSKSYSDYEKLVSYQSDLCILHLFESFLESAPQLVLQLYIIVVLNEWRFLTGISAGASLISLAWALASYSRGQRNARPEKNSISLVGLLFQSLWRLGMLSARITTLVLAAYCFHSWIFLFLLFHWSGMTIWIISQKTDLFETNWEEKIYNGVAGVIYCFCFFNLQEGQSRWRSLTFYLIVIFQNLLCLTVFLMWYADPNPRLAVTAFVAIIGGTLIGVVSMVLYYRFFHPSGPIQFCLTQEMSVKSTATPLADTSGSTTNTNTLRSLKNIWSCETVVEPVVKQQNETTSDLILTDSVVIIEEEEEVEWSKPVTEQKVDKYKRRAICSSVDLNKLMEVKECETGSSGSLKLVGTDEAPSEVLSAHDYENICAVNIAREAWGLRSWRGYSDIESWLHDDSVVRDTVTSVSSESREARTRQDDYMDTLTDDLVECDDYSIYMTESEPQALDTILEEMEVSSASTDPVDVRSRRDGSASTLVATIDEIRRTTPIGSVSSVSCSPSIKRSLNLLEPEEILFLSKLTTGPSSVLTVIPEVVCEEARYKKSKCNNRPRRTFSLIRERFEPKRSDSTTELFKSQESLTEQQISDVKVVKFLNDTDKENIPNVASKISHWDKIGKNQLTEELPKKEKKSLKQVLTPPKIYNLKKKTSSPRTKPTK